MQMFIPPDTAVADGNSSEWHHQANLSKQELRNRWLSPAGRTIINTLRETTLSRQSVACLVGSFSGKLDLRGAPLAGVNGRNAECRDTDFFCADLSGADFSRANLSGSYLSEANIRGATFDWANMDGVFLDNVDFDRSTRFNGVRLDGVNFTLAVLLQDLAIGQQRIAHLEQRHPHFAAFLRVTTDYGRSFTRYSVWVVSILLLFTCTYWALPSLLGEKTFLDCLYFSIVTFATVGYGDITPISAAGKCVVCVEIGLGYVMGGLLVALLAKRMLANQ